MVPVNCTGSPQGCLLVQILVHNSLFVLNNVHTHTLKKLLKIEVLMLLLCTIANKDRICWYRRPFSLIDQYHFTKTCKQTKQNTTIIIRKLHKCISKTSKSNIYSYQYHKVACYTYHLPTYHLLTAKKQQHT